MSTLTKVLIVLQLVMSVAFAVAAITFAQRTEDWRALAYDQQQRALTEVTRNKSLQTQRSVDLAMREEALDAANEQLRNLTAELQKAQLAVAEKDNSLNAATTNLQTQQGISSDLSSRIASQGSEIQRLSQRNERLQTDNADLQRINLDLAQRNRELDTNVQTLQAQVDTLRQQGAALNEQVSQLEQKLDRSGIPVERAAFELPTSENIRVRTPAQSSAVAGRITDVARNYATISVGSADGVVPGKTFTVYRTRNGQGEYVGTLTIDEVRANESVGTMADVQSQPQRGDRVTDRLLD